MRNRETSPISISAILTLLGVFLVLTGYFSPWIPHRAAGLALTGFEIAEWIKFAPEVRAGASSLRLADFYWPPAVAAVALALLNASTKCWRWSNWVLLALAAILSLLPFPLLEEVNSLNGIKTNWERLGLVAMGLLAAVALRRRPTKMRGATLTLAAGVGLVLLNTAFAAAEPIVESLYGQLIDPGLGYNLTRGGMVVLAIAGTIQIFNG